MVQTAPVRFAISRSAAAIESSAIRDLLRVIERPGIISMAGGLPAPEAFPTAELAEAFARILAEDPAALQYSSTEGYEPLRRWIAERHEAEPDEVLVTHGAQQALDLVARVIVEPGETVVAVGDPAYVGALQALRLAGAVLTPVPSDADGIDVDALASRIAAGERVDAVYVVPDFHNPSGATLSLQRRAALAALADAHGLLVIEDDPYGELRWAGERLPRVASFTDRVVQLGTVSKLLCPGLRVGWAVAPAGLRATMVLAKQAVDLHTSTLAQRAVHRVLATPGFLPAHLDRLRPLYEDRAAALDAALRRELGDLARWEPVQGGMFFWLDLCGAASSVDSAALLVSAIEDGVAFVPGAAFGVTATHRSSLRLSFATSDAATLAEGARRLGTAISSHL
jgi:2-aminoadipate transaminase